MRHLEEDFCVTGTQQTSIPTSLRSFNV